MTIIQLQEQILENTPLLRQDADFILPYMEDGEEVVYSVKRGREEKALCLSLKRQSEQIAASGSYFVGIDWLRENELAVQVSPKLNDGFEVDFVRMLNDALLESENFEHLSDLLTIRFDKPSIKVSQQQDILSIFLITEYLSILHRIVRKGLRRSYYTVEENLAKKVKGKILVGKNIRKNLSRGNITDNVCRYQVYDIDSSENQILKKALRFCSKQLEIYKNAVNTEPLKKKVRLIAPYFDSVSDEISVKSIKSHKGNPVFREYNQAIKFAQLLLRRYSYDITVVGKHEIQTPPFWIDMSKLFELYVFHHLRQVFTAKGEVRYHVNAYYQELDYLLNPVEWPEPYIIDAKYKPRYKTTKGISIDDAREVGGYARLSNIYAKLGLDEETAPPIKCLIIYPDQEQNERFTFTRYKEPQFEKVSGYVRFYKVGIKLPVINGKKRNR